MAEGSAKSGAPERVDKAAGSESLPVTIIIPIRNEVDHIEQILSSILAQSYPASALEVLVIDGMSDDGTREVVQRVQDSHPHVRLLDNPGLIVPTGLNLGIRESRGDIIIRIDGHADLAPDFVASTVEVLQARKDAGCVGGPVRHAGRSVFGKATALAMSHPLGIGDARQRYPDFEGYGENVAFPGFRRSVFDRVGLFDETLVRNQDDEFTYRLHRNGIRTFISRRIRSVYYVRETPSRLFRQYFQYGFWRIPVITKHGRPTSVRQVIPLGALLAALLLATTGVLFPHIRYVGLILPTCYAALLAAATLPTLARHPPAVALRFPFAVVTIHAGYALGMLSGWFSYWFHPGAFAAGGRASALSR